MGEDSPDTSLLEAQKKKTAEIEAREEEERKKAERERIEGMRGRLGGGGIVPTKKPGLLGG